ncbi:probable maltase [Contarinia nasturtii]|uniref:probable maltase n=1 Tax=Contarinia nasturtii TaxID=265458 RepID=UPI0012D4B681|nr:probable maltase [Contarinia nasturtii]
MTSINMPILALVLCSITGELFAADDWYEYGHFYQIYPRSFQDSDGDGVGDLNGITSRLSHLQYVGVSGVWLSPIFKSPLKDFGYDISDFRQIQSEYGTMEDFERLVERCKELDIKLILDFVPNHSSDQHEWFKKSCNPSDPEYEKYKDFYVWNEGKLLENGTRVPPSNWVSVFRGSAWTWVETRKAYYYHQFYAEQPDLNFRNDAVVEEMKEILRFWMRKGVGGYRVDAVPHFFESKENADGVYDDEPLSGGSCEPDEYCSLNHTNTYDLDETFDLVYEFRAVLDEPEFSNPTRVLMAEAYSPLCNALKYYGKVENGTITKYGAQIPFNFQLMQNTKMGSGSQDYINSINSWILNLPKGNGIHANWVLGNHDKKRIATDYKPTRTDIFNILLKTLPGITVTYYGEEIGMTSNDKISSEDEREQSRTPMQWDNTKNAGFSDAETTWLPVAENFTECNVKLEKSQPQSFLKNFRRLITLRENPTIKYGTLQLAAIDEEVLAYKREIEGDPKADIIVMVLNLGTSNKTVDLKAHFSNLPKNMRVSIVSIHSKTIKPGNSIETQKLFLSSEVGVVLIGRKR